MNSNNLHNNRENITISEFHFQISLKYKRGSYFKIFNLFSCINVLCCVKIAKHDVVVKILYLIRLHKIFKKDLSTFTTTKEEKKTLL